MNIALSSVFLLCIPITLLLASALSGRLSDRARFNHKSTWLIKLSGLIVVLYITALVVSIALPSLHAYECYFNRIFA